MTFARRTTVALAAAAIAVTPITGAASAFAAPDKPVTLTSKQLADAGFPKKPNVTAWGPGGTANLGTNTAAQWEDVLITGTAPKGTPVGQVLTMSRFVPTDTQGSGTQKALNITAVVQKNLSYTLHFQLGMPGTFGYAVGYTTGGTSPELRAFQFQFTTTGTGASDARTGTSTAPTLSGKKLAKAGFTKKPNTSAWAGSATLSAHRVPAGAPVTLKGTATGPIKPGTLLTLERFVPTDKQGSGALQPVGNVQTVVAADGTFSLTFEINERGRYGYSLFADVPNTFDAYVIEFQLKTT
jgi:hypothetical protein